MKCRFCGADLNPGEKYCKHCGAAVNRGVVGEPSEVKDRGKKFLTRTLIGVAVGGMAIFLLVYMIFFAGVLGNLYESTKDKGGTDTGTVTREAVEDPDARTAERQMPEQEEPDPAAKEEAETPAAAVPAKNTPTEAADAFLKAVKNRDISSIGKLYRGDPEEMDLAGTADDEDFPAELSTLLTQKMQQFDYRLSEEKITGTTATVKVTVTTVNISKALADAVNDFLTHMITGEIFSSSSEDDLLAGLYRDFYQNLSAAPKDYTGSAVMELTLVNGEWKVNVIPSYGPLINCLTGGLMEFDWDGLW